MVFTACVTLKEATGYPMSAIIGQTGTNLNDIQINMQLLFLEKIFENAISNRTVVMFRPSYCMKSIEYICAKLEHVGVNLIRSW